MKSILEEAPTNIDTAAEPVQLVLRITIASDTEIWGQEFGVQKITKIEGSSITLENEQVFAHTELVTKLENGDWQIVKLVR
jgi:hypothetical protein